MIKHGLTRFVYGTATSRHIVYIDPTKGSCYTQTVSLSNFCKREGRRVLAEITQVRGLKDVGTKIYLSAYATIPQYCSVVYHLDLPNARESFDFFDEAPIVEHDSVWDFYKAVGYDYKKKKYLTTISQ